MLGQDPAPFVSADWWEAHGIGLAIALLVAAALTFVSRRWVHRFRKKARASGDDQEGRRLRRVATVVGILTATLVVIAWLVWLLMLLSALGVDIAPILATAGIAGVALGFGAQTLVRDTISGLFILLEAQYDVGDVVDLVTGSATVSGTIEVLNLRTTAVRQYDGTLSIVPNGLIEVTNNRTRGWGRAVIDLRAALDEDAEKVRQILEELFDELTATEPLNEWLRQRPVVLGVTQQTDIAQVIRVAAETKPSHRVDAERYLRERMLARMAERGTKVPPIAGAPRPANPPA